MRQYFERTIAIEPSAPMRQALRRSCPDAVVLNEPIDEVELDARADLALCSHVFYYVPDSAWLGTVRRILSWVAPGGTLLLMLQNPGERLYADGAALHRRRLDLSDLARRLEQNGNGLVESVTTATLPIHYRSTNLDDAVDVAEFMINVPALRSRRLPSRQVLESYLARNFSDPDGAICITHTHDILTVRRSPMS